MRGTEDHLYPAIDSGLEGVLLDAEVAAALLGNPARN